MSLFNQHHPQSFYQSTFANAGHTADTNPDRLSRVGKKFIQQGGGGAGVIGIAAFDQGDRFGQRTDVATAYAVGYLLDFMQSENHNR